MSHAAVGTVKAGLRPPEGEALTVWTGAAFWGLEARQGFLVAESRRTDVDNKIAMALKALDQLSEFPVVPMVKGSTAPRV